MRRKALNGSKKVRRTFRQRNVKFALGITVLFVLGFVASGAFGQVLDTVTGTSSTDPAASEYSTTDTTSASTTDTTGASTTDSSSSTTDTTPAGSQYGTTTTTPAGPPVSYIVTFKDGV
jgi:hypothetical protein